MAPNSPVGSVRDTVITGHTASPDNATVLVPPLALDIRSDALLLPRVAGWNVTVAVVSLPPAIVVVPGAETLNSDASVPVMTRALTNLAKILDKAVAQAKAEDKPLSELTEGKLAADMRPFTFQIQSASDSAKNTAARLAGTTPG